MQRKPGTQRLQTLNILRRDRVELGEIRQPLLGELNQVDPAIVVMNAPAGAF